MGREQTIKIRSHIRPEVIRSSLIRGGPVAGCGAFLIILGGSLLPLHLLKIWGIPIFFVGIFLIGLGLFPYKKLSNVQVKPHELHYDGAYYYFLKVGKLLFKIPEKSIVRMEYLEKEQMYGLGIWFKQSVEEKIKVMQPRFNFEACRMDSLQRFGCDLFLPYFTKKDVEMLLTDHEND